MVTGLPEGMTNSTGVGVKSRLAGGIEEGRERREGEEERRG